MEAFISYSHFDKGTAAWVKSKLESLGINAFLAHEDIEPTSEWQEEIVKQLRICDIFIPILTTGFYSSSWTDQETGFAVCREILIIPLAAGEIPYGFINKYQAYSLDLNDPDGFRNKMVKILSKSSDTSEEFLDLLIGVFGDSTSFDQAGSNMGWLLTIKKHLTKNQKTKIIELAASNEQIHYSFSARRKLRVFLDGFGDKLKVSLVKDLEEKMSK
jgi:hypothetical protein